MARKKKDGCPRGMYLRNGGTVYYSQIAGVDGKIIRQRLSPDRQIAIIKLGEMRKQIELQRAGILPEKLEDAIKTFEELKLRYLKHVQTIGVSQATIVAFTTAWGAVVHKNKLVYLAELTLECIEDWAKRRLAEGLRGQTVNQYVGSIVQALRWAHKNGDIRRNVLANWRRVRNTPPRKRRDFLPDEIRRLLAAEQDPEFLLRWIVYFHTGLRASAGKDVCWEWIDWEQKHLCLPVECNKSRREHFIPLSQTLLDALMKRRAALPEGAATGTIFPPMTNFKLRQRLKKTCKAAGIDISGICLHSIRHTVATMIYNNTDGNLKAVQEVLGHVNPATTMRYLHVTVEQKRRAIEALDFGISNQDKEE